MNYVLQTCYFFSIKQGLIQALISEQEKFVKTSIGQVIGTLVKHELPNQLWPELTQFIQHMTSSEDDDNREVRLLIY